MSEAAGLGMPQAVDVEHFAQARVQELEFLDLSVATLAALESGGDGSGAAGLDKQALPRHMRRRATSHKPRRMPVALKSRGRGGRRGGRQRPKAISAETSRGGRIGSDAASVSQGIPVPEQRCRKHRRRPRAMLEARSPHVETLAEGAPARWLETHIWHAKRMHMQEAWGFMLPARSNRGPRAVVEASVKHCTVQDVTFLRPLEIRGPLQCLLGVLSTVLDPLDGRPIQPGCVKGFVEAATHLYRVNEFPLGCIAPVTIMWCPPLDDEYDETLNSHSDMSHEYTAAELRRLWIWVHPAGAKEALQQIIVACCMEGAPWVGKVEAESVTGGLCRLRVRGCRAHEIVQQVVRTAVETMPLSSTNESTSATAAAAHAAEKCSETPSIGNDADYESLGTADSALAVSDGRRDAEANDVDGVASQHRGVSEEGENVGFEDAARDNGRRWHLLGSKAAGDGGLGPRILPDGSVLSLTALDPREFSRGNGAKVHRDAHADSAEVEKQSGVRNGNTEVWPPRWAPISPLWDPDARTLSANLAGARADHVMNEHRRKERARSVWHAVPPVTAATATTDAAQKAESRLAGVETTVILISASAEPGREHGLIVSNWRGSVTHDGGNGERSGVGKELKRKARTTGSGWDIVLSAGWAPMFFHALVMAGARAISLADADALCLETGAPRFPADFPDTRAGRDHWNAIGAVGELSWQRTRPKHRGFKVPCYRQPQRPTATEKSDNPQSGAVVASNESEYRSKTSEGADVLSFFRPNFRSLARADPQVAGSGYRESVDRNSAHPVADVQLFESTSTVVHDDDGGAVETMGMEETELHHQPHIVDEQVKTDLPPHDGTDSRDGDFDDHETSPVTQELHKKSARATLGASCPAGAAVTGAGRSDSVEGAPFAIARRFPYFEAFLPTETAAYVSVPLAPLRLAMPTMLNVTLVLEKGVPRVGTTLHAASPQHMALWERGRGEGCKVWAGFAAMGSIEGQQSAESLPSPPPPMGAVTSGGFSFFRGRGIGRAVCEAVAVRDALTVPLPFRRRINRATEDNNEMGKNEDWVKIVGRQPWALVLVRSSLAGDKGNWFRPAIITVAE